ncbi:MAG: DNA-3-methyladenine glycosylase I, partial [Chloroflexi bacterium]|nr:DNA-3-methyladenine glycosylase I [Chloroflexota bacterium]
RKRERYRVAFDGFDPATVARYGEADLARLLADPGIVRNRGKVQAAVVAARKVLEAQDEHGSFDAFVWRFVDGQPLLRAARTLADLPAKTPESERMSKELRAHGFGFVGPTICYAFMQAVGMVNDHLVGCFRYAELADGGA